MNEIDEMMTWEDKIENILETINFTDEDFKRKGATSEIHSRILEAIDDEWNRTSIPRFEERAFQIDFVGRTFARHGKMVLAIEVDTYFKPTGNWVKLLDINSENKIWIYVSKERDRANSDFESAVKQFRKLAKLRNEDENNQVIIFMKVAEQKGVIKRHLFE